MIPKHPTDERKAAVFHGALAAIGVAHIIAGALMIWFHITAASRHWDDR